ncbi:hypothetical protein J6590_068102 [Homalodisca vitripennis]|nr:hypothetical protein J6590_068102 [Homalodisca vitripennis]
MGGGRLHNVQCTVKELYLAIHPLTVLTAVLDGDSPGLQLELRIVGLSTVARCDSSTIGLQAELLVSGGSRDRPHSAAPCRPHASLSGERLVVAHCFVCDAAIMASWSKDNLLQFIEEFRKHECVWKVKSKDYHNREKKEAAHRSLLLVVKGFDSTATKSDVLKKINNIRSAFRKEQRKVTASQRSGSGTDDIYVPKLWYYRELLFLIDQEECLGGTSNLGEGRVSEDEVRELNY